jgi:sporulation protein YabP
MSEENNNTLKHQVTLTDRKELFIEGVKTIQSFDSNEFLIETIMGYMVIKGKGLMLGKMDNDNEQLSIKGEVCAIEYVSASKDKVNGGFLKKIFK